MGLFQEFMENLRSFGKWTPSDTTQEELATIKRNARNRLAIGVHQLSTALAQDNVPALADAVHMIHLEHENLGDASRLVVSNLTAAGNRLACDGSSLLLAADAFRLVAITIPNLKNPHDCFLPFDVQAEVSAARKRYIQFCASELPKAHQDDRKTEFYKRGYLFLNEEEKTNYALMAAGQNQPGQPDENAGEAVYLRARFCGEIINHAETALLAILLRNDQKVYGRYVEPLKRNLVQAIEKTPDAEPLKWLCSYSRFSNRGGDKLFTDAVEAELKRQNKTQKELQDLCRQSIDRYGATGAVAVYLRQVAKGQRYISADTDNGGVRTNAGLVRKPGASSTAEV